MPEPATDTAVAARSISHDLRHDFNRLRHLFPAGDPREVTTVLPGLAEGLRRYVHPELLGGIKEHNEARSCGDATRAHIDLLGRPETVVVMATHTPCLLTGPLQVVYKALTAIQLARYARETLGLHAVPVFWLASSATQSSASRHVKFANQDDRVISLMYEPDGLERAGAVGAVPLQPQVDFLLRLLARDTVDTRNKRYLTELLRDTRARSATLGEWTERLLHALFHTSGLVVVSEDQPYATLQTVRCLGDQLAAPGRAARLAHETARSLAAQGYASTFAPDPAAALFGVRDRTGVEAWRFVNGEYRSSRDRTMDVDGLRGEIARRHASVTVSRWIRPIVQAALLPVAATVLGALEVDVHAHLANLYAASGSTMPLVYPAADVIVVERHVGQLLERYGLTPEEVAGRRRELVQRIQESAADLPRPIIGVCDRQLDRMQSMLDELRDDLQHSNPEFIDELDHIKRTLGKSFDALRTKLVEARTESTVVIGANLERAKAHLCPEGKPQAEVLNIFPYLFLNGIQLVSRLLTEVDLFDLGAQVVRL